MAPPPVSLDDRIDAVRARPLLLVAGAPNTGVEAVRAMLDAHPQVRLAPDGRFTDRLAVPLKDVISGYNDGLEGDGLEGGAPAFTQGDFLHLVRTAVTLSLAKLATGGETRIIGCAVAVHAHNLDFWELMFPDLILLHVVRDGRTAVAEALDATDVEPGSTAWHAAADAAAFGWADAARTACAFAARRPERSYELRWEDLMDDPDTHFGAALRFLELRADAGALSACLARRPAPAAHRTVLDAGTQQRVAQQQGPLLRQFGYAR